MLKNKATAVGTAEEAGFAAKPLGVIPEVIEEQNQYKLTIGKINPNYPKPQEVKIKDMEPMEYDKFSDINKNAESRTKIAQVKQDILDHKPISPALVIKHIDNTGTWYEVLDGHHKIQASTELGITDMPVQITRTIKTKKGIRPPITPKKAEEGIQPSVAGAGKGIVEPTIKEKLGAVKTYKEQVGLVTEALNAGDMGAAKSLYAGIIKSKYLPKFEEIVANAKQQKFAGGLTEQMTAQAAKQQSLKTERELFDSTIGAENVDNIKRLLKSKIAQDPDFDVTRIKGFDELAESIRVEKNNMNLTDTEVLDMIDKLPTHAEIKAAAPIEIKPPKELEIIEPEKAEGMIKTLEEGGEVIKVPATQLPVGEGKEKVSRLAARMEGVLKNTSPEDIEKLGLPTFKKMNDKNTIQLSIESVVKNPDDGIRILKGEIDPPKGTSVNSIYVAMTELAREDNTGRLARDLVSLRATAMGQELQILSQIDKNNPIKIIDDLKKRNIEAFGKGENKLKSGQEKINKMITGEKTKLVSLTKSETIKGSSQWIKLIESIKCQ